MVYSILLSLKTCIVLSQPVKFHLWNFSYFYIDENIGNNSLQKLKFFYVFVPYHNWLSHDQAHKGKQQQQQKI